MKKFTLLALLVLIACPAYAQEEDFDIDNFLDFSAEDMNKEEAKAEKDSNKNFITRYFDDKKAAKEAKEEAKRISEQNPNVLDLRDSQKRLIKEGDEKRAQIKQLMEEIENTAEVKGDEQENVALERKQISEKYTPAPFGLFWGIDKEQTELLGFNLQSAERKDYTNVYSIGNAKQSNDTFDIITAIFGEQNKLWCIFAQSKPQSDTPQADNVLKLYNAYYAALEQKYGNAKQYFTPAEYTEKVIEQGEAEADNDKAEEKTVTKTTPIGNDNFLKELQQGTAVLYATFENEMLGVTLGVSVDREGKSYISIDYKNLKIMEEEKQTKLNNLISDI